MTYQQKSAFVSLFSTVLVFGAYGVWIAGLYRDGRFEAADAMGFIGRSVLMLIGAAIVVTIVANIVFNILHAIVTNEPKPSFVVDERDRAIELRGLRISSYVVGAGFCLAMAVLALEQPLFWVFHIIVFAFAAGDVTGNLLKLHLYRRGF